eukprot:7186989-Karenia_brevis.AAC.1
MLRSGWRRGKAGHGEIFTLGSRRLWSYTMGGVERIRMHAVTRFAEDHGQGLQTSLIYKRPTDSW